MDAIFHENQVFNQYTQVKTLESITKKNPRDNPGASLELEEPMSQVLK